MAEITKNTTVGRRRLTNHTSPEEAVRFARQATKRLWTLNALREVVDGEVYQEVDGFCIISVGPDDKPLREFVDCYGVVYANSSKDLVLGFLLPQGTPRQRYAH